MTTTAISFGPIGADWIAAYGSASLDDNPVHQENGSPLGAAIVHGALLVALLERAALSLTGATCITDTVVQFLSPIRQGTVVSFTLMRSRPVTHRTSNARQFRIVGKTDAGSIFMMADCIALNSDTANSL